MTGDAPPPLEAPTAPPPPLTHLLYLHGFRSSPRSAKARYVARWMQTHAPHVHCACPALPPSPRDAMALITQTVRDWPGATMAVIGSSLGGYYATVLAEARGCRAALLNPAVHPARDLAAYIGAHTHYHAPDQAFYFRAAYIDELREIEPHRITRPERYAALIARGDEVLDWREMHARYGAAGCVILLEGGDHAVSDFETHWPSLVDFIGLPAAP